MTKNENSTKYFSERQENYIAKKFGGKLSVNSGAGKYSGGDVLINRTKTLIECKTATKEKDSFSIKKDWLIKAKEECYMRHMDNYVLAFNFGAEENHNYFIMDEIAFNNYLELLEAQQNNEQ